MNNIITKLFNKAIKTILVVEDVDNKEAARRLIICKKNNCFDKKNGTCKECGCFMEVKTKSLKHRNIEKGRIEITHCPLAKWHSNKQDRIKELELVNYYRALDGLELLT